MYSTVTCQSHQVQTLACLLCITVCRNNFIVLKNAAVLARAVYLHEVLIDDSTSTDIEVTHLRVSHLTIGQTNVFARGIQL